MGRPSDLEKDVKVNLNDLTEEIRKLSQIGKAMNNSSLKRKTIVLLLSEMSKICKRDVDIVIHNLALLEKEYLK